MFFLILSLNDANVFSAVPERKTSTKISSGESCLRKHEQYNKFSCSYVDYGKVSSSTLKKCNKLKRELKNSCERKALKCNERDTLVCGIYNVCPIGATCFVGPTYKESQNICKLLKDRKAPDQIKRGKCAEEVVEPIIDETITRECSEDFSPVCGSPKIPDNIDPQTYKPAPPQLFANSCKLKKAGFVETDFSECKDACLGDKRVCGLPKWRCPEGVMCTMVMPKARWYDNECDLLQDGATRVYDAVCSSEM